VEANQELPPPATNVTPPERNRALWICAAALGVVIVLMSMALAFRDGHAGASDVTVLGVKPADVTVAYTITLTLDNEYEVQTCDGNHGGYSDIDNGTEVDVMNGSGKLLGTGNLSRSGSSGGSVCTYSATFTANRSADGFYRVTSGNNNRGYLSYKEADVQHGTLSISASLGS
jgi:hypothetical protein